MRTLRVPGGSVCELAMLFHGPIVSTMILIPPNALSIWRCTLATSDARNSCIFWSSETNPWSSPIEFEVKRATELNRSAPISSWPESFDFSLAKAKSSEGVFSSGAADVSGFADSREHGANPSPKDRRETYQESK